MSDPAIDLNKNPQSEASGDLREVGLSSPENMRNVSDWLFDSL
jgi:hypothetical protein